MDGINFYLIPDVSKIDMGTIGGALRQAFFSLSLGMGALITYGSYLSKNDNIISSAAFITLADVGIAFIAGLMMFPFVAFNLGGDMSPVVAGEVGGPGLIFATLPGVFETLGSSLGIVIGAFFFLLLSFAALTSTVSLLEVPVSYMVDEHKMKRKKAVWLMASLIFVIGIPSLLSNGASEFWSNFIGIIGLSREGMTDLSFMTFVGWLANDTFLPLGGMLISFYAAYIWKKHNLSEELSHGYKDYQGSVVEKFINFCISYLAPVVLTVIFVLTVLNRFFGIESIA